VVERRLTGLKAGQCHCLQHNSMSIFRYLKRQIKARQNGLLLNAGRFILWNLFGVLAALKVKNLDHNGLGFY